MSHERRLAHIKKGFAKRLLACFALFFFVYALPLLLLLLWLLRALRLLG